MAHNSIPDFGDLFDGQKANIDKTVSCFNVLNHHDRIK